MAIEDNASYELTGAQVKDLADKIKAKAADNIFVGATSAAPGSKGLVPAPQAGDEGKFLQGDGSWKDAAAKLVEMSYGESNAWAKFIAAYNAGSIVYCRASSNSNPATGSQTRKAFMAYVNNATTPTEVEFQYVRSMSSKSVSQQSDQVFVYKLANANGGTWTVESRNVAPKIIAGTGMASAFTNGANATITLSAATMTGATSSRAGVAGIVPAPAAGDGTKFLAGDGTWKTASGGGGGAAIHKLTVDSSDYVWDPVICPVALATQNIYVYDPDAQGPLDVIQLVQWALNGDDFVITGAYGMGSYEKAVPFKARVDVAVNSDFDPADPQLSEIEALQISFHVTDCGSRANPTEPRVPYEYDVILSCTYFNQSVLNWEATVYQGGTLPLFYEAQLEEGVSFTWESFANARVVQGVNTPSADIARGLSESSYRATSSEILKRILSALSTGKTISVKALFGARYFTLAGVEFDRFLLESTEGYYDFSDVSAVCEAIQNERAKLYLYASGNQGLTVQFFGENITVSGS